MCDLLQRCHSKMPMKSLAFRIDLGFSYRLEPSPRPHNRSDFLSLSLRTITWSRELKRTQAVAMEMEAGPGEKEGLQRKPLDWNFPGCDILERDFGC